MPIEQTAKQNGEAVTFTRQTSSTDANQLVNSELMLIDIEPPLAPISDWTVWIEWGLWGLWALLLLVILMILAKFSYRLYRPAYLRWKLTKLMPKNSQASSVSFEQLWLFYGWCLQLKGNVSKHQATEDREQSPALIALETLIKQAEQLSFSKQTVSRETYLNLLEQAKQVLQLNCGLKPFSSRVKSALKNRGGH